MKKLTLLGASVLFALFAFEARADECQKLEEDWYEAYLEYLYALESRLIAIEFCEMGNSDRDCHDIDTPVEEEMELDAADKRTDAANKMEELGCKEPKKYGEEFEAYKLENLARIKDEQQAKWMKLKGY